MVGERIKILSRGGPGSGGRGRMHGRGGVEYAVWHAKINNSNQALVLHHLKERTMQTHMKSGIIALLLISVLVSGCAYTNIQRPLGTEFNKTELGTKTGRSSNYSVLWLIAWGNGGTKAAAENG